MTTLMQSPTNQRKMDQLKTALSAVLTEVLRQGFHGNGSVEIIVQDGTIQTVRRKVEQIERY